MEELREDIQHMPLDLDQLFPVGYVISLGGSMYYREHRDGRILCCKAAGAKRFRKKEDAEQFARRHLGYAGMEASLCEVCWVLISVENGLSEPEQYWDGCRFSCDPESAAVFSGYKEAADCQKRCSLQDASMIDQRIFCRGPIRMAA
jgi:hypothetical protein